MSQTIESILSIKVTHANTGEEVYISPMQLFGAYYMEAHKSAVVVATGGAMIPVKESVNEVLQMQLLTRTKEKTDDGTK